MNQKYLKYSLSIMFLTVCNPSFAMGGKVFKLARFVGVTTLPTYGLYKAHKRNEVIQEAHKTVNPITDEFLQKWFKEQKEQLNIPNAESILLIGNGYWGSLTDKKNSYITLSASDAFRLSNALINQSEAEKEAKEYLKELKKLHRRKANRSYIGFFSNSDDELIKSYEWLIDLENQSIDRYKTIIARDSMILKHELGHIVRKDSQRCTYSMAIIPLGIEMLSFGAISTFKKLYNMQPSVLGEIMPLRSCLSMAAIAPKALIGCITYYCFSRHTERQADEFACKNAQSRLELEMYVNYFKEFEDNGQYVSFTHPDDIDRIKMGKGYINKWDREHPAGEKRA